MLLFVSIYMHFENFFIFRSYFPRLFLSVRGVILPCLQLGQDLENWM